MQTLDDNIIDQLHGLEKLKNQKQYTSKRIKLFCIIQEINIVNSKLLLYVVPELAVQLRVSRIAK
jgi:hypothetical protein